MHKASARHTDAQTILDTCFLADCSGRNCWGFMTTVAERAEAYLLDASAEGDPVRLLLTSSLIEINFNSFVLPSCSAHGDVPSKAPHGDQRRLKFPGDSRRTRSFLATRAILVRCVHCLLLLPPFSFTTPHPLLNQNLRGTPF